MQQLKYEEYIAIIYILSMIYEQTRCLISSLNLTQSLFLQKRFGWRLNMYSLSVLFYHLSLSMHKILLVPG